jgi:hypothetical protein
MHKFSLRWTSFPFHPILISIYIVLSLFAHNIDQIKALAIYRSLVVVPVFALVLWILFRILLKDWHRSAILATLYLGLFFSYGHVYHFLETNTLLGLDLGRHRILMVFYLLLAGICAWLVARRIRDHNTATKLFNLVCMILLIFPVFQIISFNVRQREARQLFVNPVSTSVGSPLSSNQNPPDIYYIIVDGYSRADILKDEFDFDNSPFIRELQQMGFYVAACSQANYTQTLLSMSSSLNLNYVDALDNINLATNDPSMLNQWIQHNTVQQILKDMGYTRVAFETNYYWLNQEDVDIYYSSQHKALNPGEERLAVNGFEAMLMRQSAGLVLTDMLSFLPNRLHPDLEYPNRYEREMVLYDLDKLQDIPLEVQSPKFVYAHILAPHRPIVFGPNGEWVSLPEDISDEEWAQAYTGEIQYINQRILQVVREIITVSATPPVIVLQADHGAVKRAGQENRPEILNAYFLPGDGDAGLYPTISPVNTFRIIFNRYFGGNYPLLGDATNISYYDTPFTFYPSVNHCP